MPRESDMTFDRWLRLMEAWGFARNEDTCRSLLAAYSEKGRHYHGQEHVSACLRHLDTCLDRVEQPREVELALWFHDAIYKPFANDNERKSANWAASFLTDNGASEDAVARVRALVMATRHSAPTTTNDESILVDIDLAILGADPQTYDLFERGVRSEYRFVPRFVYRKKRAEVLRSFLERPRIYQNEPFFSQREGQARGNLRNAIAKLGVHR